MKLKILLMLVLMMLFIVSQWPTEKLKVVFCDVGQGDAQLLIKGYTQILIDGGPSGEGVMKCLGDNLPFWDREIELVVNTHADRDHIGGLDEVASAYEIGTLLVSEVGSNQDSKRLMEEIKRQSIKVHAPRNEEKIRVSGIELEVLWPVESSEKTVLAWSGEIDGRVLGENDKKNENSIVLRLSYGKFSALFTGDIGEREELMMLERLSPVTVLKVPHHGSKYSSSEEFVRVLSPRIAVFEVGKNSYGHPDSNVLSRYDMVGSSVYRTDFNGQVTVVTDGLTYVVEE